MPLDQTVTAAKADTVRLSRKQYFRLCTELTAMTGELTAVGSQWTRKGIVDLVRQRTGDELARLNWNHVRGALADLEISPAVRRKAGAVAAAESGRLSQRLARLEHRVAELEAALLVTQTVADPDPGLFGGGDG